MLKQSVLQQCLDMRMIVSLIFMLIITVETNYAELLVRSTGKAFNFVHHSFHSRYFASCWTEERICDFFCICCQLKEIKRKNVTFRRLPLGLPAIAMSLLVSVAGRDKSCLEWLHWEIYIYIYCSCSVKLAPSSTISTIWLSHVWQTFEEKDLWQ